MSASEIRVQHVRQARAPDFAFGSSGLRLLTGTNSTMTKKLAPVHPGEILREDFLKPMKLTAYAVAAKLGVSRTRIERLTREESPVTADTALRLGKFFGTTAAFWMNIQSRYDLEMAEDAIAPQIRKIARHQNAAA